MKERRICGNEAQVAVCTIATTYYRPIVESLYRSLLPALGRKVHFYILCDRPRNFTGFPQARLVPICEVIESKFWAERSSLPDAHRCFLLKPHLLEYLARKSQYDTLLYMDSDFCYYSSPGFDLSASLSALLAGNDLGLVPHGFDSDYLARFESELQARAYGIYNAGLVAVKNSPGGRNFIAWWRKLCRARMQIGGSYYVDQKYLDLAENNFAVGKLPWNWNLGPWNWNRADIAASWDDKPCCFVHYHDLIKVILGESSSYSYQVSPQVEPLFISYLAFYMVNNYADLSAVINLSLHLHRQGQRRLAGKMLKLMVCYSSGWRWRNIAQFYLAWISCDLGGMALALSRNPGDLGLQRSFLEQLYRQNFFHKRFKGLCKQQLDFYLRFPVGLEHRVALELAALGHFLPRRRQQVILRIKDHFNHNLPAMELFFGPRVSPLSRPLFCAAVCRVLAENRQLKVSGRLLTLLQQLALSSESAGDLPAAAFILLYISRKIRARSKPALYNLITTAQDDIQL